jgi:pyruvate dehydrogenase E2 component (dihydrolipoamide acetyltransferase)
MNFTVPMPSLGADMDQGKIMEWKIAPGDTIKKGQTMAIVETTKSAVEIESFHDGKVLELIAQIGEMISVGKPIATFDVLEAPLIQPIPQVYGERVKISPIAKRLAEMNHLNWEQLKGSGLEGEIELKDVEAILGKKEASTSVVNLRKAIAKSMGQSKKEIPHFYLKSRILIDALLQRLDEKNKLLPAEKRLLLPVLFIRAITLALKDFPELNGYYKNDSFLPQSAIHIGYAFAVKSGGVMVPAILDCHQLKLEELNTAFLQLASRVERGELKNRELTEGTVTITNVGDLGSDEVYGIIFPPQVALIGIGRIHKEPIALDNQVKLSWVIDLTLSIDHRVTDGITASRFLNTVDRHLQQTEIFGG